MSSTLSTLNEEHINCNLLDIILWIITTKAGRMKSELFCFILFLFYYSKHNAECYSNFSSDRTSTQLKEEKSSNNVNICIMDDKQAPKTLNSAAFSVSGNYISLFCEPHARFPSETLVSILKSLIPIKDVTMWLFSQMPFCGSGPYLYPPPVPGSHCIPSDRGSRPLACCICSVKKGVSDEENTGDRIHARS